MGLYPLRLSLILTDMIASHDQTSLRYSDHSEIDCFQIFRANKVTDTLKMIYVFHEVFFDVSY